MLFGREGYSPYYDREQLGFICNYIELILDNVSHYLLRIMSVLPTPTGGVEAGVETLFRMLNAVPLTQISMRPSHDQGASLPVPTPILIHRFVTDLQSLELVKLEFFIDLDEEAVNALHVEGGSATLEIEVNKCTFTNRGRQALVELLRNNQGPTKLACGDWYGDCGTLAEGLRGNTRINSLDLLAPDRFPHEYDPALLYIAGYHAGDIGVLMDALKGNIGL